MNAQPLSLESGLEFLSRQAAKTDEDTGWRMFMIVLRENNQVIGETGAFLRSDKEREADIGWWLHCDFRGYGYATEAAKLISHWCLNIVKVAQVTSHCLAENSASLRIMNRLGMVVEPPAVNSQGLLECRATLRHD